MITLDMSKKLITVPITDQAFDTTSGIVTLSVLITTDGTAPYDLTGKTVTARFNPAEVESAVLSVVDGKVQLPVYSNYLKPAINYIQLIVREGDTVDPAPMLKWAVGTGLKGTTPATGAPDIVTALIAEVTAAVDSLATVQSACETAQTGAELAESNAETSATNASTSAANALLSEQNALTSEQHAKTSEDNALGVYNDIVDGEAGRNANESVRISNENARNVFETYSAVKAYVVNNKVAYNGSSYVCILASTGNLPTNATYWLPIALKGDYSGDIIPFTDTNSFYPTDEVGDALVYAGTKLNFPATNLVTNGDFSNGTTGWTPYLGASLSASNNTMSIKGTGADYYVRAFNNTSIDCVTGKKVYTKIMARVTNESCLLLYPRLVGSTGGTAIINGQSSPVANQWYTFNSVSVITNQAGVFQVGIGHQYAELAIALDKVAEVKYVLAIDLTATFGAGNEPSLAEMDAIMANYPNSWFDGTVNPLLTSRQMYNDKASKVQEAWITPTLLNGWVDVGSADGTFGYRKNSFGELEFKGGITGGAENTIAFNLQANYVPSKNKYSLVVSTLSFGVIYVNSDSSVLVRIKGAGTTRVSFDNVTIRLS
ncbi:hypothetical protein [Parasporobacterium paucivorans]|uniref:BppU N-terminal domain-containing protein n=1 Tax=Parasporobacterium paucivorans DSM 15970 TaxID=1122934 RepID=A0A1M6B0B7_9FIRM|nr:hypothetical protein [Parasporobacterium paucivorans]SHI42156.1 hypothetical protein SAMN02745691_00227 [Parasporobacterium paucivorans DSM 15970]